MDIRWLNRGIILKRFSNSQEKDLAFFGNITSDLKTFNTALQGPEQLICHKYDSIKGKLLSLKHAL